MIVLCDATFASAHSLNLNLSILIIAVGLISLLFDTALNRFYWADRWSRPLSS